MDLKELYGSFKNPGGFKGKENFFRYVKSIHPEVTRKQIENFLLTSDTYTLHVPKRNGQGNGPGSGQIICFIFFLFYFYNFHYFPCIEKY